MTYPHESWREHVKQEAPDELLSVESHRLLLSSIGVVLPAKRDAAVVERNEAIVRDGDAMGIASQVLQDLAWPTERFFRVDNPFGCVERGYEFFPVGEASEFNYATVKRDGTFRVRLLQIPEELVSEQAAEDTHGNKEIFARGDPASLVGGDPAAGNNAVDVRVVMKRLSPGMEDGQEADFGAEMLWLARNGV